MCKFYTILGSKLDVGCCYNITIDTQMHNIMDLMRQLMRFCRYQSRLFIHTCSVLYSSEQTQIFRLYSTPSFKLAGSKIYWKHPNRHTNVQYYKFYGINHVAVSIAVYPYPFWFLTALEVYVCFFAYKELIRDFLKISSRIKKILLFYTGNPVGGLVDSQFAPNGVGGGFDFYTS